MSEECVICLEAVARDAATWQCGTCYLLCHLPCAQAHARASLAPASKLLASAFNVPLYWSCPHCRAPLGEGDAPRDYRCFCGARRDPADDPWLAPHTCGGVCGRRKVCGHTCAERCHAGACGPCVATAGVACFCGAVATAQRCGAPRFSCGARCGHAGAARLGGGVAPAAGGSDGGTSAATAGAASATQPTPCAHACARVCHDGPCGPCPVVMPAPCACRRSVRVGACADVRGWRCAAVCGKPLPCGRHACTNVCCDGAPCSACPAAGVGGQRSCYCGATPLPEGTPCDAPLRSCGGTCGAPAPCGVPGHACSLRCHPPATAHDCAVSATASCRCGRSSRARHCGDGEFLCDTRCPATRNCGRHACRRRCCPTGAPAAAAAAAGGGGGGCPPCREECRRPLSCGQHACAGFCGHAGACGKCPRTETLACACGATRVTVPCGAVRRGAAAPACGVPCARAPLCGAHAAPPRHGCHAPSTPCPPCIAPCGRPRPRCAHTCDAPCCAARGAACPPCAVPVARPCVGGHESQALPCAAPALWRCGVRCAGVLSCGRCPCPRGCHAPPPVALPPPITAAVSASAAAVGASAAVSAADTPHTGASASSGAAGAARTATASETAIAGGAPPAIATATATAAATAAAAVCGPCTRLCSEPRPPGCTHACGFGGCHAPPCPPCVASVTRRCHCGTRDVAVACAAISAASTGGGAPAVDALFSCGGRCRRTLPGCDHACALICHAGPCGGDAAATASGGAAATASNSALQSPPPCVKDVAARCACGRRTGRVPCHAAQAARRERGRAAALLPCDASVGGPCAATVAAGGEDADAAPGDAAAGGGANPNPASQEDVREPALVLRRRRREEAAARALAAGAVAEAASAAAAARSARLSCAVRAAVAAAFTAAAIALALGALGK